MQYNMFYITVIDVLDKGQNVLLNGREHSYSWLHQQTHWQNSETGNSKF